MQGISPNLPNGPTGSGIVRLPRTLKLRHDEKPSTVYSAGGLFRSNITETKRHV